MKFPGGLNIQGMMKQAQVMQEKMAKEMEELRTEASSGGGVVTVEMKGNHEIVSLKIDPEAVKDHVLKHLDVAFFDSLRVDLQRDDFMITFHFYRDHATAG